MHLGTVRLVLPAPARASNAVVGVQRERYASCTAQRPQPPSGDARAQQARQPPDDVTIAICVPL